MTVQMTSSKGSGFFNDLDGAVRENPIAASLIGMGVLWMLFGGTRISVLGDAVAGATKNVVRAVGSGAGAATKAVEAGFAATTAGVGGLARNVGDTLTTAAQDAGAFVRDAASSSSDTLKGRAGTAEPVQGASGSSSMGAQFSNSMQQSLHMALERQPLVLGAIGLAIGAGIAATFASTQTENELMGDAGAAVRDGIQTAASDVAGAARKTVDDMATEVDRQGLTPSKLAAHAKEVGDKLKTIAEAARGSVKERVA